MPGSMDTTLLFSPHNARYVPAHHDESASIFRDEAVIKIPATMLSF